MFTESASAFSGFDASTTTYCRAENIRVVPIVVAELKFGDVERQIFAADLVETADDATLQQRPEAVDCPGVDNAVNVLLCRMPHKPMGERVFEIPIAGMFVGRDQADFFGYRLPHEGIKSRSIGMRDHSRHDVALAADCADDRDFAGTFAANAAVPLVPVFVVGFAADIGFVYLDDAHEFAKIRVREAATNAVAHIPSRMIRAEAHHTMDLKGADTLLASQHQIHNFKPCFKADVRVFENRADQDGEAIAALFDAFSALPVKGSVLDGIHVNVPATRAMDALGPTARGQILLARIIGREQFFELRDRHLRGEFDFAHREFSDA